jgi:hypothetical protein
MQPRHCPPPSIWSVCVGYGDTSDIFSRSKPNRTNLQNSVQSSHSTNNVMSETSSQSQACIQILSSKPRWRVPPSEMRDLLPYRPSLLNVPIISRRPWVNTGSRSARDGQVEIDLSWKQNCRGGHRVYLPGKFELKVMGYEQDCGRRRILLMSDLFKLCLVGLWFLRSCPHVCNGV